MQQTRSIQKVIRKAKLTDKKIDAVYWRTQSPSVRLASLEEIRREYHLWRYGAEPRFQRVYRIVKR